MSEYKGRTLPEPREGITGTDRTEDDLLSLDDLALPRRFMMVGLAECLSRAVSVGQPAPIVRRMSDRMRDPQPGDLVYEVTTLRRREVEGFGILIAHREEWWTTDGEWERYLEEERAAALEHGGDPAEIDDERTTDHAWYVQYGPAAADVCRWVNCQFTAIPTDHRQFARPVGQATDTGGVTVTRDDLIGSLADSGFALRLPGAEPEASDG